MTYTPALDRLVRKEVALGEIRERPIQGNLIGLRDWAPFKEVESDDVIFEYVKGNTQEGMTPARAEDAEAELAQADDLFYGSGRAAIIDWAEKSKYTASDVTRYREDLFLQERLLGVNDVQLPTNWTGRAVQQFQDRLARDTAARKRRLDLRLEWLIMTALETGGISYNDGKIKFSVDFGRPAGQQNVAPAGGLWNTSNCDPIGDLLGVKQYMRDTYGIELQRGLISSRIVNSVWKSNRFLAAVGVPVVGGTPNVTLDPNYLGLAGYNPAGALAIIEQATGIRFTIYDTFYRTRPIGSKTFTNNRFISDNKVILAPDTGDSTVPPNQMTQGVTTGGTLGEIDDTDIGFAKTLTSPHPEGLWQAGFYEWEDETKDPWMHVRGSGIKAFPVFPYMEYTYSLQVL